MPRPSVDLSIEQAVQDSVEKAVAAVWPRIDRAIQRAIEKSVGARVPSGDKPSPSRRRRRARQPRQELTKWTADKRARRVPTFVIEMTGLDTKKKIIAKYGENAAFEKGKSPPKAAEDALEAKPEAKAKPPLVRKKAKAAA